jgi:hypothetical protein
MPGAAQCQSARLWLRHAAQPASESPPCPPLSPSTPAGFRERLLADPAFLAKLSIELGIGFCTKLTAEYTKRQVGGGGGGRGSAWHTACRGCMCSPPARAAGASSKPGRLPETRHVRAGTADLGRPCRAKHALISSSHGPSCCATTCCAPRPPCRRPAG